MRFAYVPHIKLFARACGTRLIEYVLWKNALSRIFPQNILNCVRGEAARVSGERGQSF